MIEPVLSVQQINKHFGALQVSKDVSLDLLPGEIHALIGPNGAGKSTLIQQIAGELKPDSGRIMLAGHDVTQLGTAVRSRRGLARTFQISALAMEDTVLQNALLGALGASAHPYRLWGSAMKRSELRTVAEQALDRVGLADQAHTVTAQLSHGQRRQLEIAVALTLSPKAFIMDEPMAGLGTQGSSTLTGLLGTLREQAPILMVEHDMEAVFALADRISVLVYGQLLATGTVAQIRSNQAVQQAYLGTDT